MSTTYHIGDESNNAQASWSMASAYLFSLPMGNELPRLFHHLGPRYFSNFQSSPLVRFFTYEAATSLSIYLQSLIDAKRTPSPELSLLLKGAKDKDGPGISEDSIIFAITPFGYSDGDGTSELQDATVLNAALRRDRVREKARIKGDVVVVKPQCLDVAVWKIGGAAIPLRLVELSQVCGILRRQELGFMILSRTPMTLRILSVSFSTPYAPAGRTQRIWNEYTDMKYWLWLSGLNWPSLTSIRSMSSSIS
jgi:hypothetical protein